MSIPTSLIVVLLVVAWLVVLVPMIARRRERVPRAEPTGSGFRVLRRASASLRRRPVRAKAKSQSDSTGPGGQESDARTEVLVTAGGGPETGPADAAEEWAAAQAGQRPRTASFPAQSGPPTNDEQFEAAGGAGEVGDGFNGTGARGGRADEGDAVDDDAVDDDAVDDGNGAYLTAERAPAQAAQRSPMRMAPDPSEPVEPGEQIDSVEMSTAATIPDEIDEQEWTEHVAAAPAGPSYVDVEDEQLRPVPHRPGRGGFDPEAAEATRAYRYQQRRRVTVILLIATVAFTLAAMFLVSWLWVGAVVSLGLLVGYLTYLRRQVRIEAAIRQRRMERLQRARQIRPEYARPPRRQRQGMSAVGPGRTVVDLDDDDPAFDDLDEYQEPMTYRRAAGQ